MDGQDGGGQRTITGDGRLQVHELRVDAPLGRVSIVHPPALRTSFTVGGRGATIGREVSGATPPLEDPTVSRRHLAIEWHTASQTWFAADLGSRNGSWVDGRKLTGRTPLASGAVIRGGHVLLVFEHTPVGARLPWTDVDAAALAAVSLEAIPGQSLAAHRLRAAVARAAPDVSPALVVGETGTGKELIAAEIHRLSGRRAGIVALNCAALSPQLIESQLFGHVRGAFTGADEAQPGLVRAAHGGTLFLDEIGELPLPLQAKLLRMIQEGEVQPVGSARAARVDVRIVAATNRDLAAAVQAGSFRRDLYARLALWEVHVAPLRDRRPDILEWAFRLRRLWLERRGAREAPLELEPLAAEAILTNPWPENLRGIDRLVHELAGESGPIGVRHLPPWMTAAAPPAAEPTPTPPPRAPTREELEAALREQGSVRATAKLFGRDRRQIYRWMDAYGIDKAGR